MATDELISFLLEQCKKRGISLRRLSINSGLSPGTVHSIITREYQPTLFSLNRLADYLGVRREYLWQLGGLIKEREYNIEIPSDHELRHQFARAYRLPAAARMLIISIMEAVIVFLETQGIKTDEIT